MGGPGGSQGPDGLGYLIEGESYSLNEEAMLVTPTNESGDHITFEVYTIQEITSSSGHTVCTAPSPLSAD